MNKNKITFYNVISTIVLQGLAFFTIPIFSRKLGTENYGVVSIYLTWVSLAATVFSLQTHNSLVSARNKYSKDKQNSYQSSTILLTMLIYIVMASVSIVACFVIRKNLSINIDNRLVFCTLIHGWGMFCVNFLNTKYIYEFKARQNAILSIAVSVSTIILSMLLINFWSNGYWGRIIGLLFPYMLVGLITPVAIWIKGRTFIVREYANVAIRISAPIVYHSLAHIVLAQSDRVMLQYMDSISNVGIYSLVYSFTSVMSTIWGALNNSYAPFYYKYIKEKDKINILNSERNYTQLFTVLCCGFILLSREVYKIFADETYTIGTALIPILVLSHYFVFIYSYFVNYEIANDRTKMIAVNTVVAAIINIFLNVIFISRFSILGAALATLVSYCVQCIVHYFYAIHIKTEFALPISFQRFIGPIVAIFLCSACYYVFENHFIIRWGMGIAIGIYEIVSIVKRRAIF